MSQGHHISSENLRRYTREDTGMRERAALRLYSFVASWLQVIDLWKLKRSMYHSAPSAPGRPGTHIEVEVGAPAPVGARG
jgi:hypothetical protein